MKMKLLFTILLSLFVFANYAQDARFSIAVESNIGISDRVLVHSSMHTPVASNVILDLEKQTLGYDIGLLCSYKLNQDLSITAGLKYVS